MSSNNNLNDSTSVITSNESYLPFPTDVVYVEITRRAKRHYRDVGQNSWKHIQQVYSQAARACSFVDNRDLNLKEYAAILYHDSSVKTDVTKDGHNIRGARIAKSELVDLFSKSDLLEIVQAIEEHDGYTSWSSTTSDLLATGDANPPDIPWILNKSYTWGIKKGLDHDGRIRNILATLPKKYGTNGTMVYPSHYLKYFGNSLKAAQKYIDHLTYEKVEKAVLAYRKQHKLSDTDLTLPEPSVEELDVSELEPLEINPEHKTDRFKDDKLAINEIDEKSLNMTIVEELERHVEYLEILKHWITTPDYTLVDKLAVFGAFIDKLYNFNKGFIAYRGMRVGKTDKPLQNTMGIIDATESELVPKPGVIPGYKFTYTTTGPMSVSRSVWLSKVYGDCIVKTTVPKECKKLVITNELAYVLQKLDKKYPDYRPINLSARLEIIVLPNQTLNYSVVTTNGDITSEMPEFKDLDYSNKKIELDPTYSIGEEQLSNLLLERRTIKSSSENMSVSEEKLFLRNKKVIDKLNSVKWCTQEEFVKTLEPGDILIPYPKDKYNKSFTTKIFRWLEKEIFEVSFTSSKVVVEKNLLMGYGVRTGEGTHFAKITPGEFIKRCGGCLVLRTCNPIAPTKLKKFKEFCYRFYKHASEHNYDNFGTITGTVNYILDIVTNKDQTKLPLEQYNKLFCSSFVAAAYAWSGIDLGLPKIDVSKVLLIHLLTSDNLKCVAGWFANGELPADNRRTLFESEIKEVSANEALSDAAISKKKREIIDKICKICDIIDPSKLNSKRYHRLLDDMTPKEFNQWMTYVKDGKWVLHIVAPNMMVNLKNENLLKAADAVGVKLFHRIWMTDSSTGRKFLTDNEYLVLPLPIRRQQQFLDEKMSVPDDDKHIDGMTGQVTGDSKATQITTPEINILAFKGLDNTLDEMVSVRGGNMVAYGEFKKQAEDTGIVHLNTLDPTTHSRTAVVAQVLLHAMHIENNIVPETQI